MLVMTQSPSQSNVAFAQITASQSAITSILIQTSPFVQRSASAESSTQPSSSVSVSVAIENQAVLVSDSQSGTTQLTISTNTGVEIGFISLDVQGAVVLIKQADDQLINQAGNVNDIVSAVVDISLVGRDGKQMKLEGSATICLKLNSTESNRKQCLSYIDTSVDPPVWKCQDECLEQVSPSFWCGQTDHFTNFAVLLRGSKSKDRLDVCGDNSEEYFAGSAWIDGLISILVAIMVLVMISIIGLILHVIYRRKKRTVKSRRNVAESGFDHR